MKLPDWPDSCCAPEVPEFIRVRAPKRMTAREWSVVHWVAVAEAVLIVVLLLH